MINYPGTLLTNRAKMAYVLRAYGKIREEHNIMGKWYRPEEPKITLEEYNKLRLEVRLALPHATTEKPTKEEYEFYIKNRFNPVHDRIINEVARMKGICYESTTYDPDMDNI